MSDYEIDPKEKLLTEFLLSSKELFIKCSGVIKPEYFDDPINRVIKFTIDYFMKYHNIPDLPVVYAETGIELETHEIEKDEFEYICDETEKFCQESAMRIAILEGADVLSENANDEKPDFGKISNLVRDALMVSIDKDLGTDYFDNPAIRLMRMQEEIDARSIGWINMDMAIDKVKRGEMFMFAGESGTGKSVVLANVANNFAKDKQNVLIISLELDENLISKRVDSIVTQIENKEIFDNIEEVVDILGDKQKDYGRITVKKMSSGTTSNQIRAYLTEYEIQYGYKPDAIIVDYLDLMGTNEKVQGNVFDIDKVKSEQLRDVFQDYRAYGFTASQLNRDSVDTARKSQSHIAGGLSKINTSDVTMAIIRTEDEKDNGEVHFQILKLRNADFSYEPIVLYWNDKTLEITEKKNGQSNVSKKVQQGNSQTKNRLNDILKKKDKK